MRGFSQNPQKHTLKRTSYQKDQYTGSMDILQITRQQSGRITTAGYYTIMVVAEARPTYMPFVGDETQFSIIEKKRSDPPLNTQIILN